MAKRKKHPRLPNGYGNIRYLGNGRKNCYAVHPPAEDRDEHGRYLRPAAICYVDDWYVGFAVLNAWRAGTYKPGDELVFKAYKDVSESDLDAFCRRLLTDYSAGSYAVATKKLTEPTFAEVYQQFFEWKYGENVSKKLSPQSKASTQAGFQNCKKLHDKVFTDLRLEDLQRCLDENSKTLKKSSISIIMTLLKQMYKFAEPRELCNKNYAQYLTMPAVEDNEHGVPFSDEELAMLWSHKSDPTVEFILIMCYSGYRIKAYESITVNLEDCFFQGGVKTDSGKNRIVPIHSAILPLVQRRISRDGALTTSSTSYIRSCMYKALDAYEIERHTPHDCRHTFSRLCEKYGVNENDRKRMMGHSFGTDITNGIYGHRTLEELRTQIEKIQVQDL